MEDVLFTIFDVFNFGLLMFLWGFTIKHYKNLPQTIPVHFNFDGKADNFGSRKYSFLMPVVLTGVYFLFVFAVRSPGAANYPVEITPKNEHAQFLIMKIFMRWLCLLIIIIFFNNQDYMFRYAADETVKPRIPMATAFLSIIASLIVVFIFVGVFK